MNNFSQSFDVVVIGAGHAGCEAALAASKLGLKTALYTINLDTVAQMSCNPSVGGIAKGHLVREIDALGGVMARVIDRTGIQFRMLNRSKGPAVQAPRAQADRVAYRLEMRRILEQQEGLQLIQGEVTDILVEKGKVVGVQLKEGERVGARAVIVTTGTFLNGLIHIGMDSYPSGRADEPPSVELSTALRRLGLSLGRLKTGTPPRLKRESIDFSRFTPQPGDDIPVPFSFTTEGIDRPQIECYLGYTTPRTHEIIRENLHHSPLYSGKIVGIGPRYCPSIEVKVVNFPDKERHQVFLEPEGYHSHEVYANGVANSLPVEVQKRFIRSIPGLEEAELMRPGYAIEYDFVYPTQLKPSLETKPIQGLFLAGQINGTSGYEEAAAQGLMAGINASLKLSRREPLILKRSEAYIGVMIDDLVTKGTQEPYRMFTSRAEYRLLLRVDNADLRLTEYGHRVGLIDDERYRRFTRKKEEVTSLKRYVTKTYVKLTSEDDKREPPNLKDRYHLTKPTTFAQLLRRPGVSISDLKPFLPQDAPSTNDPHVENTVETEIKYEGYIRRQLKEAQQLRRMEGRRIPQGFPYHKVPGLTREAVEKLREVQPRNLGQASRIPGITPAAISILHIFLRKRTKRDK